MRFVLLYQCGLANVFSVHPQGLHRVYQGDYCGAELIAQGAKLAGAEVEVMHWDGAGDALERGGKAGRWGIPSAWHEGRGELWADRKAPPLGWDKVEG